jgi:uncharacterized RmlC-like cupin family protein
MGNLMQVPPELAPYFSESDLSDYPLVNIPQVFQDLRGTIMNLADGAIGDVAVITSNPGSVRANHYHLEDWHLCYVVSGSMNYSWKEALSSTTIHNLEIAQGQMLYTPKLTPHRIKFSEETIFVTMSKLSRLKDNYELDTTRFESDFLG